MNTNVKENKVQELNPEELEKYNGGLWPINRNLSGILDACGVLENGK